MSGIRRTCSSAVGIERMATVRQHVVDTSWLQGTLNWMYKGEVAVRAASVPYCVVRPCGLVAKDSEEELSEGFTLELGQGDAFSVRSRHLQRGLRTCTGVAERVRDHRAFRMCKSSNCCTVCRHIRLLRS